MKGAKENEKRSNEKRPGKAYRKHKNGKSKANRSKTQRMGRAESPARPGGSSKRSGITKLYMIKYIKKEILNNGIMESILQ